MSCAFYSVVFRFSADSLTWLVCCGGEVLSRHRRKADAVRVAASVARAVVGDSPADHRVGGPDGAVLTIERMDGTVAGQRRYGRTDGR